MPRIRTPRVFNVVFDILENEDTLWDGLELKCRGLGFGRVNELMKDDVAGNRALMISHILESAFEWDNVDEDGKPIPLNAEELNKEEYAAIIELYNAWSAVISGNVSSKKERSSNAGPDSREVNIPMEPLSSSPPS